MYLPKVVLVIASLSLSLANPLASIDGRAGAKLVPRGPIAGQCGQFAGAVDSVYRGITDAANRLPPAAAQNALRARDAWNVDAQRLLNACSNIDSQL